MSLSRLLTTDIGAIFIKSTTSNTSKKNKKQTSKAEPSVPSYGKVIYDVVICNTFKACISLLFIS